MRDTRPIALAAPATRPLPMTASIVIEWYNFTYAARERARRMMAGLHAQSLALRNPRGSAQVILTRSLDVVVVFDPDRVTET